MNLLKLIIACLFVLNPFSSNSLVAAPLITFLSPSNGAIAGGNVVTITGSGFTGATNVDFGFRPATSYIVLTDNSITAVVPEGTSGTVDVRVTAAGISPITHADLYTYTEISWKGIISGINQDAITLFDTFTNTIVDTIPLPFDSLSSIITPDGTKIYAADNDNANINVIDAATSTIIANIPIPVSGVGAFDIIVNPAGTQVYISNLLSGYVTVIDTLTNTVVTDIFVAPGLGAISITPDGQTLYVSNFNFGSVIDIDTATFTVGLGIFTGSVPGMTSITPDGTTAYLANAGSDTVSIIDVATNTLTGTILFPAGSGPYGSSILPNGLTIYVANIYNATVSVVDLATNSIIATIPLLEGPQPFWVVSTPDSKKVYVLNETTNDVTPIDVATNTAGASFANIPGDVQDIVMSPDQAPVASFVATVQPTGVPTQFDASASISPIGTIVSYAWDFGDTNTLVTNTPIAQHIYATSGPFTVTLQVTNSAGTSTAKVFSSRFMSNNGGPTAIYSQSLFIAPLPPINVRGYTKFCPRISNVIRWNAPTTGELPVAYRIYRDAALTNLAASIPATDPLIFRDKNLKKHKTYTYYIVSVSANGTQSTSVLVILQT